MVGVPRGGSALGELMALLSPLAFAVVIVVARRHRDVSMTPATALAQLMLVLGGLPFIHAGQLQAGDIGWLALLGLGQQGFGLVFFTIGARLIPAAAMGLILLLESGARRGVGLARDRRAAERPDRPRRAPRAARGRDQAARGQRARAAGS